MQRMIRTYSELIQIPTFEERFEYLKLRGNVGNQTFGYDRYLNQNFYKSSLWRSIRNQIILRDMGCDLAIEGREIYGKIIIHHMNPLTVNDIEESTIYLMNPEFLICVSNDTHQAIHYGDRNLLQETTFVERKPNDTSPWR
jgi:hypothetical protein